MLATSVKHLEQCQIADKHYRLNAKRMQERYCNQKKVHTFEVGDTVALWYPRLDRAATNLHRLSYIVVQRLGKENLPYRLGCEFAVLNALYRAGELEKCNGAQHLKVDDWVMMSKISLREAAKRAKPDNVDYGTLCNCKRGCRSKQCS